MRTDNISALTLVCRMQTSAPRLALIAREIAMDIARSIYSPDLVAHIPGIANAAADALSRVASPSPPSLPAYLTPELATKPPPRNSSWWRTIR